MTIRPRITIAMAKILLPAILLGSITACNVRTPPPPESPMSTPAPTPSPAATTLRYHIGEPTNRYPLPTDIPITPIPENAPFIAERQPDGALRIKLPLKPDEAIWGFGQRFDAFNLTGRILETWTTDGWNALDTSYFAVPFFISSRGHGLFINHPGKIIFDIGKTNPGEISILIPDTSAEMYVFEGEPSVVARAYTELAGRPRSAPEWIYRPWISRNSYLGAYEVDRVVRRMKELGMPVGVVVLEAWAEQLHNFRVEHRRYPEPEKWIKRLQDSGVRVLCWITSSVWENSEAYRQAKERGYLVRNEDGSEHIVRWLENGRKIDFRIPEARTWWRDLMRPMIDLGIDGIKTDGGEHMPDPMFHNLHSFYYQQASLDAFTAAGREGITFSRSASSPCAGLSAFWAGDQNAEWSRLKAVVRGGLSTSLSGFFLWAHDIGAYTGNPTNDLYLRWLQLGAFSPIMQFHGIGAREPWHYDEETIRIARFYFQVRERLLPHLKTWGDEALRDGVPIIRPLVWHFPHDRNTHDLDSQFMLGPDLLVAPVTDPIDARGIYLPAGTWIDLWSGETHTGPKQFLHRAALYQIPVFVRAEAYETYRDIFTGAPTPDVPSVEVRLVGPRNIRGVVPSLRYWKNRGEAERVYYEITNHRDTEVELQARLSTSGPFHILPEEPIRFRLFPGEVQRLAYSVMPDDGLPVGSHRFSLILREKTNAVPAPSVDIAVLPRLKVLGPFEHGVGSTHDLDNQPVRFSDTFTGRHGRSVTWQDVPDELIDEEGLVHLESLIGADGFATYYLHAGIHSDQPRNVRVISGFGDGVVMWLNGQEILNIPAHRNAERDEDQVTINLRAGDNTLLIKNSRDLAPPAFFLRLASD
jgi:hypothetical protein